MKLGETVKHFVQFENGAIAKYFCWNIDLRIFPSSDSKFVVSDLP